jgi:hypothetical protein
MSNSAGALWRATEETLLGLDHALNLFSGRQLPDRSALRRAGRQGLLLAVPTHDIFSGRLRRGWRGYWEALRRYPLLTAGQPRTAALILRTLLGPTGYDRFRNVNLTLRPKLPADSPAA